MFGFFSISCAADLAVCLMEALQEDDSFEQITWLIRLSSIFAIAYPTEYWSTARLEKLLEVGSNQVGITE